MIERVYKCDSCGLVEKFGEFDSPAGFFDFILLESERLPFVEPGEIRLVVCSSCYEPTTLKNRRSLWRRLKELLLRKGKING